MKIGLKLWSTNTGAYLREAKRLYAEGVFDYLELFVVPGTLDKIPCWQAFDVPYVIHHAHSAVGFNPADVATFPVNEKIVAETRQYVDALDPEFIIFHAGTNGAISESARQLAYFKDKYFPARHILVENKPFRPLPNVQGVTECRGSNVEELTSLIDALHCGFCLDFGHAVAAANSQHLDPYAFIKTLQDHFLPSMYHLSDFTDMASEFDAHPHLGMGNLDIARLVRDVLPLNTMVSIETVKDVRHKLDDFGRDAQYLRGIK